MDIASTKVRSVMATGIVKTFLMNSTARLVSPMANIAQQTFLNAKTQFAFHANGNVMVLTTVEIILMKSHQCVKKLSVLLIRTSGVTTLYASPVGVSVTKWTTAEMHQMRIILNYANPLNVDVKQTNLNAAHINSVFILLGCVMILSTVRIRLMNRAVLSRVVQSIAQLVMVAVPITVQTSNRVGSTVPAGRDTTCQPQTGKNVKILMNVPNGGTTVHRFVTTSKVPINVPV